MTYNAKKKSWTQGVKTDNPAIKKKVPKFDFEVMKSAATHEDQRVRKAAFIEYFERFGEFPSYLFDNEVKMDSRLSATIQELQRDPETPKNMLKGIESLIERLPS